MITLITPTRLEENRIPWLEKLCRSVDTVGDIEHIIVVDGGRTLPTGIDLGYSHVVFTGKPVGAGAARNYGLLRASGKHIASVDDDDLVNPQGLLSLSRILDKDARLGWASGYLQDMRADGTVFKTWEHKTPLGHVPAGGVFEQWRAPRTEFPIAPSGILCRRESLLSVGGWGALPQGEDFLMVMKLTGQYAGYSTDEIVYYYRKHEHQMTRDHIFQHAEKECRAFCFQTGKIIAGQSVSL